LGFKSKAKAFFIDVDSPACPFEGPVNIILSPSLYWVKRVKLPVKYLREVRSLIPSLFEDNLPPAKYSYAAYKDDDSFLIFAYNDRELLDIIAQKGILSADINNVYLAQSEFDTIEEPISIGDESVLSLQNGVVVKLPAALAREAGTLDLEGHNFSKHSIHLTRINQIADRKSQVVFATILGILIFMFSAEWLITSAKASAIKEKESRVFAEHKLPATSFQNEAIYAKLNTTYERQILIRDITTTVLGIELAPEEQIQRLALEKNKVIIEIKSASLEAGAQRLSKLSKEFKETTDRYADGIYTMEIRL